MLDKYREMKKAYELLPSAKELGNYHRYYFIVKYMEAIERKKWYQFVEKYWLKKGLNKLKI